MKTLDRLTKPVIQGGMGVGISMGSLAGAVAKAGGMGVISTANIGFREPDFWTDPAAANARALEAEIKRAQEIAEGKGLLAINAMVATSNFDEMVRLAADCGIDAVISGAGLPLHLPELIKGRDVLLAPIVSSGKAAKMMMKVWTQRYDRKPDFFVVEGSQAGGHLGFSREELLDGTAKSLLQLVEEVCKEAGDIPVFAAGSVFDKAEMQAVKKAGAVGCQIGTAFIATKECDASQGYKDIILQARAEDVMILQSPVGMPGRGLRTPLTEKIAEGGRVPPERCIRCIKTCKPAETPYCISKALIEGFYGNREEGLFFCGGNVGRIHEMTDVETLMEKLAGEWRKA